MSSVPRKLSWGAPAGPRDRRRTAYPPAGGTPGGRRSERSPSSALLGRQLAGIPRHAAAAREREAERLRLRSERRAREDEEQRAAGRPPHAHDGGARALRGRQDDGLGERHDAGLCRGIRARGAIRELAARLRERSLQEPRGHEGRDREEGQQPDADAGSGAAREEARVPAGPRRPGGRRGLLAEEPLLGELELDAARGLDAVAVVGRVEKGLLEEMALDVREAAEHVVGDEHVLLALDAVEEPVVPEVRFFEAGALRVGHPPQQVVPDLGGARSGRAHSGPPPPGGCASRSALSLSAFSLSMRFLSSRLAR